MGNDKGSNPRVVRPPRSISSVVRFYNTRLDGVFGPAVRVASCQTVKSCQSNFAVSPQRDVPSGNQSSIAHQSLNASVKQLMSGFPFRKLGTQSFRHSHKNHRDLSPTTIRSREIPEDSAINLCVASHTVQRRKLSHARPEGVNREAELNAPSGLGAVILIQPSTWAN